MTTDDMDEFSMSEYEKHFFELETKDWVTELGFNPARFGIDVGMGTVNGERIGLASALACALARQELWEYQEWIRARQGLQPET